MRACVRGWRSTHIWIYTGQAALPLHAHRAITRRTARHPTRPDPTQPVQVKQWLPLLSPIDRVGCIVFAGEATLIDDDAPITFLATESNKKEARANTLHHGCNAV